MKKVGVVVAGVVALGVIGVPATAYVAGKQVESGYKEALSAFENKHSVVRVVGVKYDRGFFSSASTVTLRIGCDPVAGGTAPAPTDVVVHNTMRHGPFLPGGRFGAALIDTTVALPADAPKALKEIYGNRSPLTAKTIIGFGHGYKAVFESPSVEHTEEDGTHLTWGGVKLEAEGNTAAGSAVRGKFSAPLLQLQNTREQISLTLRGVEGSSEGTRSDGKGLAGWLLSAGKGEGHVALIEVSGKDKMPPVKFDKLTFNTEQSTDKNGLLQSSVHFFGSGVIADSKVELDITESAKRIHVPSLLAIIEKVYSTDAVCAGPDGAPPTPPSFDDPALKTAVFEILSHDPEYGVDKFALQLEGKRGEFGYTAGSKGVTAVDKDKPLPVILADRIHLTSYAKLPTSWIPFLAKKLGESEEQANASIAMANAFLDNWTQQGFVKREGEFVSANFEMNGKTMLLNGKPFNPAALMGGAPAGDVAAPTDAPAPADAPAPQ